MILPVWHGVSAEQVTAESPTLAARLAVDTVHGIERVADEVQRALEATRADSVTEADAQTLPTTAEPHDVDASVEPDAPGAIHDRVLDLLRKNDTIGLDETLRAERNAFERAVDAVTNEYINLHLDEATVRKAGDQLAEAAQRWLASLIPLALHRPGGIQRELRAHGGWMSRTRLRGGGMTWQEAWRWPWWVVGMALGSLLCRLERYEPIGELVHATWINRYNEPEGFIGHPADVGNAIAGVKGARCAGGQPLVDAGVAVVGRRASRLRLARGAIPRMARGRSRPSGVARRVHHHRWTR